MNAMNWPILSLIVWLPIVTGAAILFVSDARAAMGKTIALAASLAALVLTVLAVIGFDMTTAAMQFQEKTPWIEAFSINYHLGR